MKTATILREYDFEAAHWLPLTPPGHKCRRLHGHSYRVRLQVTGPIRYGGGESGMVVDFGVLDRAWHSLWEQIDHTCLNETLCDNPSVENMAPLFWAHFQRALTAEAATREAAWAIKIWLHEGPRSTAVYPPEG